MPYLITVNLHITVSTEITYFLDLINMSYNIHWVRYVGYLE